MYKTPEEYYLRLHFPRSRFARRFEDMLLLLAGKIVDMGMMDRDEFNTLLDKIIKENAPGSLTEKTIRNQRTEMIRLYGLVKYVDSIAIPGNRLALLTQTQDIPRFFKSYCNHFQFPGGFLKADKISEMVIAGVKFKPAAFLLRLFMIGEQKYGEFAIDAAEAAHFIFNDKRVTVDSESPDLTLERIKRWREKKETIDRTSDVIRYARDFLNLMVEANLLIEFERMYAINKKEMAAVQAIVKSKDFFNGYENVFKTDGSWDTEEYKNADARWMEWLADTLEDEVFKTQATALVKDDNNLPEQWKKIKEILERKDPSLRGAALKEIGDEGERIVMAYEQEAVKRTRPDLVRMVKLVSNATALGYDIISIHLDDGRRKKYIEVKTTKKNYESDTVIPFTISINEWSVAQQQGADYFIYRVIITKQGVTIFSIQNPHKQASDGNLIVEPVGFKVIYSSKSGTLFEL